MPSGQQIAVRRPSVLASGARNADAPSPRSARHCRSGSLRPAGLVMVILMAWSVGCGEQPVKTMPAVKPSSTAVASAQSRPELRPRLWLDDEMAQLVKSFGYDEAYVIRWRNGAVQGWVEFDNAKGVERVSLDSVVQNIKQSDQKAASSDGPIPPGRVASGWIAVAMRTDKKSPGKVCQCHVQQWYSCEYKTGKADSLYYENQGESNDGRVRLWSRDDLKGVIAPPLSNVVSDESVVLLKQRKGKGTPWLDIRLVAPPR